MFGRGAGRTVERPGDVRLRGLAGNLVVTQLDRSFDRLALALGETGLDRRGRRVQSTHHLDGHVDGVGNGLDSRLYLEVRTEERERHRPVLVVPNRRHDDHAALGEGPEQVAQRVGRGVPDVGVEGVLARAEDVVAFDFRNFLDGRLEGVGVAHRVVEDAQRVAREVPLERGRTLDERGVGPHVVHRVNLGLAAARGDSDPDVLHIRSHRVAELKRPERPRQQAFTAPSPIGSRMKVFIAGATGVLGRRIVDRLADCDHEVVGLARDDAGERTVERRGGTARRGDVLDPETLDASVDDDVDVVVHAATAIPASTKPSEAEWSRNDRVRSEGARNLLDAAPEGLRQVVFPSVVWVARQPDGSPFDETDDRHPDRATRSAAAVERFLEERAAAADFDAAVLRCGFLYAPDARDTRNWGERLLNGDLPVVGGGLLGRRDAELSFVHADDAAAAFVAAVEAEASGIYHVVDDEPVTGAAFFETFAERLGAPEPGRIPAWLARFIVGKVTAEGFTRPMPTTNEKAKRDLDWEPEYPTYRDGIEQVVETWRTTGTLSELRGDSAAETSASSRGGIV